MFYMVHLFNSRKSALLNKEIVVVLTDNGNLLDLEKRKEEVSIWTRNGSYFIPKDCITI